MANLLTLQDVKLTDLDEVAAWMYALDMTLRERHEACCQLLGEGQYTVSNIEHRVTLECHV